MTSIISLLSKSSLGWHQTYFQSSYSLDWLQCSQSLSLLFLIVAFFQKWNGKEEAAAWFTFSKQRNSYRKLPQFFIQNTSFFSVQAILIFFKPNAISYPTFEAHFHEVLCISKWLSQGWHIKIILLTVFTDIPQHIFVHTYCSLSCYAYQNSLISIHSQIPRNEIHF